MCNRSDLRLWSSGADGYFAFEEGHGLGEAFAEGDLGFPAEEGAGLGDVGAAAGGGRLCGSGSKLSSLVEPVTSRTAWAHSRIVNSTGLPMLTG